MRLLLVIILIVGWAYYSDGATYYQVNGAFRSFPRSATAEAGVYYNEKLWSGDQTALPWNYGFWRVGAFAAVHAQAGVKIEVFPISIWQISLQRNITSRFYDTQSVDCTIIECRGVLSRGILKTSLAVGYGDFFFVPGFSITDLSLNSMTKNFSSEEDNLVADKEGDQLTTVQFALGYKMGDHRFILASKSSQMKKTKDENQSQYLVWSKEIDKEWSYFVGAGAFKSTHVDQGFSMVAGANWSVGDSLSFF